jgi:hypothetical protein
MAMAASHGNQPVNQWVPAPRELPGFPQAKRVKPKTRYSGGMRKRWRDRQGRIYEWDYQHGTVEIYDSDGAHQGEYDPVTTRQIKGRNPRRYVEP